VKPETQNRRSEPTGLAKLGETSGLTGTGPGLARQQSAGWGFGPVWYRTDPALPSKPGTLAGYLDPLRTLLVVTYRLQLCIYGNRVEDTFLQRIGRYREWHLWHFSGSITYRSSIDSDIALCLVGWAEAAPKSCVSERWNFLCAGRHRFKPCRKEENIYLEWSKMNYSEACFGVESYVNNDWRLVKIGHWVDYGCGVNSETIKLDRMVPLRCARCELLCEKILGCIVGVSLRYASRSLEYDTSTRYRLDSLCIPAWLKIFCTGSISGGWRCWQRFSCAVDWKSFNNVGSVNITNSVITVASSVPLIVRHYIIGIKLGGSGTPENSDLVSRFRYNNSTLTQEDEVAQPRRILTREYMAPHKLDFVHCQIDAPAFQHIMVHPNQVMIWFTR